MTLKTRFVACACVVLFGLGARARLATPIDPNARCRPTVVFWAWERAEDLRFLDARCTAVAWLAGEIDIDAAALRFTPRRQELQLRPDQVRWPVLRIEAHGDGPAAEEETIRRAETVRTVGRFLSREQLWEGLQIDFDAPRSWRSFYTGVIGDLKSVLPAGAPLTITALASWCLGDPWFRDAPAVTDAVPMLFRMGPDGPAIRRSLAAGTAFRAPQCGAGIGISLDEPPPERAVRGASRVYVFSPGGWTPAQAARAYALAGAPRGDRADRERW